MKKLLLRVLKKAGLLKYVNFHVKSHINRLPFLIPISGGAGLSNVLKTSEPWMIRVLDTLINEMNLNNIFIDVGVNIGQTLLKLKSVSGKVKYIGFEPNPFCTGYVEELKTLNHFENVEVFPVGIGDTTSVQKIDLFSHSYVGSSATLVKDFRNSKIVKQINVPVFRTTDLQDFVDVSIIKIDVEGAELEVLKELSHIIKADHPVLIMEILPDYEGRIRERVLRQKEIQSFMAELGYMICRILKSDDEYRDVEIITDFGSHSDLNLTDYLLFHESISGQISENF